MIKNIIFDLAGVVLNLNIERDTRALHAAGFPDYEGCKARPEIITPMSAFLNGLIPTSEFFERIRTFCKPGVTDEEILWAMNAVLDDIPKSRLELIAGLKKRYRVYLLSNIYADAWAHAVHQMELNGFKPEDCFDRLFLSNEMQLAKPDPRIFHKVFEETGLIPQETIYFDDTRENIEMGRSLGLHACLVPMNHLEACLEDEGF